MIARTTKHARHAVDETGDIKEDKNEHMGIVNYEPDQLGGRLILSPRSADGRSERCRSASRMFWYQNRCRQSTWFV